MTLTVDAGDLARALVQTKLAGGMGTAPVRLADGPDGFEVMADNRDVRIRVEVPVLDGRLDEPLLVPWKRLEPLLHGRSEGVVRLDPLPTTKELRVAVGRSTYEIPLIAGETFPQRAAMRDEQVIQLGDTWKTVRKVARASAGSLASETWKRDLYLVDGWAYATNGFRVYRSALPQPVPAPLRLPSVIVNSIINAKTDPTELRFDGRNFELVTNEASWFGTLGNAHEHKIFVNGCSKVFEGATDSTITTDRGEFLAALAEMHRLVVSETGFSTAVWMVRAEDVDDRLTLVRADAGEGAGNTVLDAQISGPLTEVGFDLTYLTESLKLIDGDQLTMVGPGRTMGPWRFSDGIVEMVLNVVRPNGQEWVPRLAA